MTHTPIEIEEAVLGACLLEPAAVYRAIELVTAKCFGEPKHQILFKSIINVHNSNKPVDLLTVTNDLRKNGRLDDVGGAYWVTSLTSRLASTANLETHALIVYEHYIKRELYRVGTELATKAEQRAFDVFDLISDAEKQIGELTTVLNSNTKHVSHFQREIVQGAHDNLTKGIKRGILTGFKLIDNTTGGWQPGNLILLAARPGMGKTATMLALAADPACNGTPVGIFSLEMTGVELTGRLLASETFINSRKINQMNLTADEIVKIADAGIGGAAIYIDDTPAIELTKLKAKARKMVHEFGVGIIFVDYLQLVVGTKKHREQEIAEISSSLKALAKELNIPVIALSQLSRDVEKREDKRPQLSDLRESGSLEQDADMVIFLFRPAEYELYPEGYPYGNKVLETRDQFSGYDLLLFDIAKARAMDKGELPLKFSGQFMNLRDYEL